MANKKIPFYKTKGFKLFITVWIVYIFYLQMFGSSSMANTQSALTASIVNEGRFEIDTYHKAGGNGNAFYNGHYYSGQAPGISFISVPIYLISKPIFYVLPQNLVDNIFEKLEKYGESLPEDWQGEKKVPSNYFPTLSKRQVLEYMAISGFILPIFTTSLIVAFSVVLLYSFLAYFTKNTKLRMAIALLYAFGTLIFPLSTEFFERPIAIALMFFAFIILFRTKHKKIGLKRSSLFASGILAGFAVWFDYFHLLVIGILFIYLVAPFRLKPDSKRISLNINLNREKLLSMLSFAFGALIPILLLGSYQYIIFDDPLTTSYSHRPFERNAHQLSGLSNIALPDIGVSFNMVIFFLYSPIIIIALYGLLRAFFKKDKYFEESLIILMLIAVTFAFSTLVVLSYFTYDESIVGGSFKRYMTPILPFIMLFIPYAFATKKLNRKNPVFVLFVIFGAVSVFMNWLSAQFGGHWALGHFNLESMKLVYIERFLETGPSSSFLNTLSSTFGLDSLIINLAGLAILSLIIYIIWKPNRKTLISSKTS